uniref:RING-type domain-containing protein n=1 Tax=Magallana gigas TaxID=29159 RepID=A0A8W8JK11_MAGGI
RLPNPSTQSFPSWRSGTGVSPNSPECSLQSTVAIKCIQMGYPELTVRKAINIWQTRHGSRSFSLTDLVNVILDLRTSDSGYNSVEDLSNEENLNVGDSSESGSESVTSSENSLVKDEKVKNIDRTSVESEKLQENRHISAENVECSNDATKNHIENEKDSGYDSDSDDESESISDTEILQAENAELKERLFCRVCKDNTVSVIFLPCAHMCTCAQCYPAMKECPICTSRVKAVVKAFLV